MDEQREIDSPQTVLHKAVQDAELLLSYAMRHGISIGDEVSATIVNAKRWLVDDSAANSTASDGKQETAFWQAFGKLSVAVSPVTVKSLNSGEKLYDDCSLISRFCERLSGRRRQTSDIAQTVRHFRLIGVLVLILLIPVHLYWMIGSTLIDEISSFQREYAELENQRLQRQQEVTASGGVPAQDQKILKINADLIEKNIFVEVNYKILEKWNGVWRCDFFRSNRDSQDIRNFQPLQQLSWALRVAGFALVAIQFFLLPLIYGLLGSLAYVLRTLAVEASALTYTKECDIHYRLRIMLGALAGLVVVWFMKEPDGKDSLTLFKTLSPFAAAFLVGYSVEIFFSILDRFIAAFSYEKKSAISK